jgi:hypothetical protein
MLLALILVVVLILLPVLYLVLRFRSGDESEGGGSMGRQMFGHDDDDWGPKPS